jgi:hypothetical protein
MVDHQVDMSSEVTVYYFNKLALYQMSAFPKLLFNAVKDGKIEEVRKILNNVAGTEYRGLVS